MEVPDVSVVVPTLDGGDMLERALRSATSARTELIVVDNGSADGSDGAAEALGARVIRNEMNLGFAPACNQGAAAARGRYVLFLNNDAVLPAGGVDALIAFADADEGTAVWQPVVVSEGGSVESAGDLYTRTGFLWHLHEERSTSDAYPVFAVLGACMLVRRDVLEALGGFVESYFAYFEEADLCWRARMAGWEVRVVPTVRVEHCSGTTTRRILRPSDVYHLSYRNRFRSIVANLGPLRLLTVVPVHVLACVAITLRFLVAGRGGPAMAVLRAIAWPALHPGEIRRQRRAAAAIRRVADRDVLRSDVEERLTPARALQLLRGNLGRW
jgi:N-acetylglucosaminyl-diphospho-decaprenol L-rhamnosyltransferase